MAKLEPGMARALSAVAAGVVTKPSTWLVEGRVMGTHLGGVVLWSALDDLLRDGYIALEDGAVVLTEKALED